MVLSESEFRDEFPGEGEHLEFKTGVSSQKIREAVVAFSNTDGGVVLVGVNPSGSVAGLPQPGESIRLVHEAIRGANNPGRYDIHQLAVTGGAVLAVSIERRHEGFAQTPDGVIRVRRGASNPPLLGADLSRFIAGRAFHTFEGTATTQTLAEVDRYLLERLRLAFAWGEEDLPDRLNEAGLTVTEQNRKALTVAGALLLLHDPQAIGCRAYIDLRRYQAEEPEPDKTWTIGGSVAEQVEGATAAILAELGSTSAVLGVQRVDMPRLPPRAIREAIANAVAHRSYQNVGSAIRVEILPDRVRITSPGGLPEPVTVENLRYQQAARNSVVLGALRRLGLAEDLGRGIDRIEDDMAADLLQPPEFEDDGSFFAVTLRLVGAVTPVERAWVKQLIDRDQLDARSAPVVVHAARNGLVTNSEVRAILGVDSVDARHILQQLVAQNIFEQQGERGGAQYVLTVSANPPVRIRRSQEELEQIVLAIADEGPVTNSQVREHTGLDRLASLDLLQRLVAAGRLVQEGERRGTRYVRGS